MVAEAEVSSAAVGEGQTVPIELRDSNVASRNASWKMKQRTGLAGAAAAGAGATARRCGSGGQRSGGGLLVGRQLGIQVLQDRSEALPRHVCTCRGSRHTRFQLLQHETRTAVLCALVPLLELPAEIQLRQCERQAAVIIRTGGGGHGGGLRGGKARASVAVTVRRRLVIAMCLTLDDGVHALLDRRRHGGGQHEGGEEEERAHGAEGGSAKHGVGVTVQLAGNYPALFYADAEACVLEHAELSAK